MNSLRLTPVLSCLKGFKSSRGFYCTASQMDRQVFLNFYKGYFGMKKAALEKFLERHPRLRDEPMDIQELRASAQFLKENFRLSEILKQPNSLLVNRITLSNRLQVMRECCFSDQHLNVLMLHRFVAVMNKKVSTLKAFSYIRPNANVPENLEKLLDVPLNRHKKINEDTSLNNTREIILNLYLKAKLDMTEDQVMKQWKIYGPRIKHRNFKDLVRVMDILQNRLNLTTDKILKNGFLIGACPESILELLESVPEIDSIDIKEILIKRPKLAMVNPKTIRNILDLVKSYNIPEERVLKDLDILTLSYNTVVERFNDLKKVPEFDVLCEHPRVLRLIHCQNKAKMRLDYLKELDLRCASLHILSSTADNFEKYAREGIDKTKGIDTITHIAKVFDIDAKKAREILVRHPHWCNVPVLQIKNATIFLKEKNFTNEEIVDNLTLLLYPIPKINDKLNTIDEIIANNQLLNGVDLSGISNSQRLSLALYLIEVEFHFSGDGIWDFDRYDHKRDIVPAVLPEFPKSSLRHKRHRIVKGKAGKISQEEII